MSFANVYNVRQEKCCFVVESSCLFLTTSPCNCAVQNKGCASTTRRPTKGTNARTLNVRISPFHQIRSEFSPRKEQGKLMGNSVGNKSSVARSSSSVQGNFRPICSDIANVTTTTTDRIASESTVLHRLLTKQSLNWLDSEVQSLFLPEFPLTCSNTKDFLPAAPKANDLVAVGAFGKVFKVDCFALKVIDKSKILEEDLVKQVKQELQILKIIAHHPFVVKFIDCWQSQKELFIVTEFIVNGELLTLLKSFTRFPIEVVKVYLIQLALVLDFLHNAGIIYRDLKAENVLLDSDFNVRLIDFGLSKWLPYGRTAGTVCGTAQYIAPEVLSGGLYGHSADWWSLGVLTCCMMTGQFPKVEKDHTLTPLMVILPTTDELNASEVDVLQRLLCLDPSKRLKSMRTLQTLRFLYKFPIEDVSKKSLTALQVWKQHYPHDTHFKES